MTISEAREYCRLRASGSGLFERNVQEALRWLKAYEELEEAAQQGYGSWPLEAAIAQATKDKP